MNAPDSGIGNDSGPTHLAAWLGIPTLALFGPSNATHWAPRGRKVENLVAGGGRDRGDPQGGIRGAAAGRRRRA